ASSWKSGLFFAKKPSVMKKGHVRAKQGDRYAQVLPYRERRGRRLRLVLLHVLDEEAANEIERQHQIEHGSRPQTAVILPEEEDGENNERGSHQCFVDLGGMPRLSKSVARENDSPRNIGDSSVDLGIEEVPDADRRNGPRGADDYSVREIVK